MTSNARRAEHDRRRADRLREQAAGQARYAGRVRRIHGLPGGEEDLAVELRAPCIGTAGVVRRRLSRPNAGRSRGGLTRGRTADRAPDARRRPRSRGGKWLGHPSPPLPRAPPGEWRPAPSAAGPPRRRHAEVIQRSCQMYPAEGVLICAPGMSMMIRPFSGGITAVRYRTGLSSTSWMNRLDPIARARCCSQLAVEMAAPG